MSTPIVKKRNSGVFSDVLATAKEQEIEAKQRSEEKKKQKSDTGSIEMREEEVQPAKRGRKPSGKNNVGKFPIQTYVDRDLMIRLMALKVNLRKPICDILHDAVVEYVKEHE